MARYVVCIALTVQMLLAGCDANYHSIFRTTPKNEDNLHSQLAFSGAKQSVSFMQIGADNILRVCAARSPDVFSTLSTAFSGPASAETAKLAAALSGAGTSPEQAAAFGLRTQLTQSQMELLYQLCIASLNGTLAPDQFATEMHRYQNTMVTMLAIEQVTGYARPTIVAIGGQSSAGAADALASTQGKIEEAKQKEAEDNKTKADGLAAAKKSEFDKATVFRESLEKLMENQEKAVNLAAGSAVPVIVMPSDPSAAAATKDVTQAVENLQRNYIFRRSWRMSACVIYSLRTLPGKIRVPRNLTVS